MIRVERKINKKIIISLILLVAFIVLLVASILLNALGGNSSSGSGSTKPPLEVLEGESTYSKYNVAYEYIKDGRIMSIEVSDKENSFLLARMPDELPTSSLVLSYRDKNGNAQIYYPDILLGDEEFEYDALYAIEEGDGMGMIPLVSYLCSAVGITAFQERVKLSDDTTTRAAQLESFGFSEGKYVTIQISYTIPAETEGGEEKLGTHVIKIGKKTVAGSGRYFMVDDRDYIYCSSLDYFDYGLQGFASFIKPYVVTEGMSGDDSILAAYLTREFTEWHNTVYDNLGDVVASGSQVIVNTQTDIPYNPRHSYGSGEVSHDGYLRTEHEKKAFYLDGLENDPSYSRLLAALVGNKVGVYYDYMTPGADASDALLVTLISQSKQIDFSKKDSLKYEYSIVQIESVLTDTYECEVVGTPVGDHKLIKVAYSFKVDGVDIGEYLSHAVVDLSDERIPADTRAALAAASVGELDEKIDFSIDYTEENAVKYEVKLVVSDILEIYDKEGKPIKEVAADSTVVYRYYYEIDGKRDEEIHVGTVSFAKPEEEGEDAKKFREALVGKKASSNLDLLIMTSNGYYEILYDFVAYRIAEIEYFVTSELVTSFGYVNASDRDPFFAESYYGYTDKMKEKNPLYGINADVCMNIIKYFMGVSDDTSSSSSATGLAGTKTVELGITPENMEKYGLYAYTLYIELPRGIYSIEDENYEADNALDNYGWRDTISFYLYISEEQPDGTRYIASNMYDLIAEIDGEMFKFLEYDFSEFWARRTLLLVDFMYVENMQFKFGMDDLKGEYNLDITHDTLYFENGKPTSSNNQNADVYNVSEILVTQLGDCVETEFSKYLAQKGTNAAMLHEYYSAANGLDSGNMLMGGRDYLGSANYKSFINLLYGIHYAGYLSDLTESEKDAIKEGAPMMSMSVQLDRQAYSYTYDFHRIDDRRIMVTLYRTDVDGNQVSGEVSDFYLSTFAFKKIVRSFFDVLNAKMVDTEVGYPKED